jgi:hypothetical protein
VENGTTEKALYIVQGSSSDSFLTVTIGASKVISYSLQLLYFSKTKSIFF